MTTPLMRACVAACLVLLVSISVTSDAPSVHAMPRQPSATTARELGRRMLAIVNRSRAVRGLPLLRPHHRLSREAVRHSKRMAREGAIFHTPNLADLVRSVGGSVFGEDLGRGRGLHGVRDAWLRRADTRRIMLDPRFRHAGVGAIHAGGFYWITLQVFN